MSLREGYFVWQWESQSLPHPGNWENREEAEAGHRQGTEEKGQHLGL